MTTNFNDYLKKLRKVLPKGYATIIAERANVSSATVYHVFAGRFFNEQVFDAAIALAEENADKINCKIQSVKKVISNEN